VIKFCLSPRMLRSCLFVLAAFEIASLLLAFEQPARAYVDPGSGFVFLQVVGSMFAGALYYLRHRVKRIVLSLRRSPASVSVPTDVVETQR
jgi:hypothetical protein